MLNKLKFFTWRTIDLNASDEPSASSVKSSHANISVAFCDDKPVPPDKQDKRDNQDKASIVSYSDSDSDSNDGFEYDTGSESNRPTNLLKEAIEQEPQMELPSFHRPFRTFPLYMIRSWYLEEYRPPAYFLYMDKDQQQFYMDQVHVYCTLTTSPRHAEVLASGSMSGSALRKRLTLQLPIKTQPVLSQLKGRVPTHYGGDDYMSHSFMNATYVRANRYSPTNPLLSMYTYTPWWDNSSTYSASCSTSHPMENRGNRGNMDTVNTGISGRISLRDHTTPSTSSTSTTSSTTTPAQHIHNTPLTSIHVLSVYAPALDTEYRQDYQLVASLSTAQRIRWYRDRIRVCFAHIYECMEEYSLTILYLPMIGCNGSDFLWNPTPLGIPVKKLFCEERELFRMRASHHHPEWVLYFMKSFHDHEYNTLDSIIHRTLGEHAHTLFVNEWNPCSFLGNGHDCDESIDGHFGRHTAMAYLGCPWVNPLFHESASCASSSQSIHPLYSGKWISWVVPPLLSECMEP